MALISPSDVQTSAKRAAREAAPWIQRLARMGFAAKGLVYLIIGGLALRVALGEGGRTTDSGGALRTILEQPYGAALLGIVAVGLAGYALWSFVQATLDPEGIGGGGKGTLARAAHAISGAIHTGLALQAARMAFGLRAGGDGGSRAQDWTALVLAQPMGRWLVAAAGLAIAALGLVEGVRAYRTDLPKRLDLSGVGGSARAWIVRCGRMGMAARGVVFGLVGGFLLRAALTYDAGQARGLGGALDTLHQQAYGRWLLGLVATGLVAYGLFELVLARYRRITVA
jgi:hypothetical protein